MIYTFDNALLTLVSQAYGQRDYQLCAKYLNRQIHLVFMISLPQALLFYFGVDTVLGLLGLNPDIALKAALYVKTCVFGHMFLNISNCYQKYLSAQREVKLQMYSNLISMTIHIFVAITLVRENFGIEGIAISMCINYIVRFVSLQIIIVYSPYYENLISLWDPTSRRHLYG